MADKPLSSPLPADLPEDWTDGQIVAPFGPSVELSEQHGYNYLMAAVNAAHRAINTVNNGFESITGKRTVRFVVGTSTAGWTDSDCDYLCDGNDDQMELNAACAAAQSADGGEVILLGGLYRLAGTAVIPDSVTLRGNGAPATALTWEGADGPAVLLSGALTDVACIAGAYNGYFVDCPSGAARLSKVSFSSEDSLNAIRCQGVGLDLRDCIFSTGCTVLVSTSESGSPAVFLAGNRGGFALELNGVNPGSVVSGNILTRLKLLNTKGCLVSGNVFTLGGIAVTLGAGTRYCFVAGNQFTISATGDQASVADSGEDNIVRYNSDGKGSPPITFGTTDLTPGVSELPTGAVYLMYE